MVKTRLQVGLKLLNLNVIQYSANLFYEFLVIHYIIESTFKRMLFKIEGVYGGVTTELSIMKRHILRSIARLIVHITDIYKWPVTVYSYYILEWKSSVTVHILINCQLFPKSVNQNFKNVWRKVLVELCLEKLCSCS